MTTVKHLRSLLSAALATLVTLAACGDDYVREHDGDSNLRRRAAGRDRAPVDTDT